MLIWLKTTLFSWWFCQKIFFFNCVQNYKFRWKILYKMSKLVQSYTTLMVKFRQKLSKISLILNKKKTFLFFFAKSPYSHDQIMSKNNICAQNHPIMMVKFCQNCKKKMKFCQKLSKNRADFDQKN